MPIQCQRCWLIMANRPEMELHANQEIRCERQEPRPEGIDPRKMDLIKNTRGATWETIYEILFPGAPIPNPCTYLMLAETLIDDIESVTEYGIDFELCSTLTESLVSSTSGSRDLHDFEEYNRRVLPQMVEANLQSIVNAEMAPIETNLRALLVDIVRRCQATVAQNFHFTRNSKSTASESLQSSSTGTLLAHSSSNSSRTNQPLARGPEHRPSSASRPNTAAPSMLDTGWSSSQETSQPLKDHNYSTLVPIPEHDVDTNSCACTCHISSGMVSNSSGMT